MIFGAVFSFALVCICVIGMIMVISLLFEMMNEE